MGDAGLENGIRRRRFEPLEKARHFRVQPRRLRGLIVDELTSDRSRHDLHGVALGRAPRPDSDAAHATAPRGEKRRVPPEQPLRGQRLSKVLRSVEHHFNDAFDVAIRFDQPADIHAQAAGDRRTHLLPIQHLTLDLAGLQHVLCQGSQDGFFTQRKAQRLHVTDQPSLAMAHGSQRFNETLVAPAQARPTTLFVNVRHNHRILRGESGPHSPQMQG
ncbi:hypothetical protein D3C80_1434680 [compost metagenome]